jgi:hypothetical protein
MKILTNKSFFDSVKETGVGQSKFNFVLLTEVGQPEKMLLVSNEDPQNYATIVDVEELKKVVFSQFNNHDFKGTGRLVIKKSSSYGHKEIIFVNTSNTNSYNLAAHKNPIGLETAVKLANFISPMLWTNNVLFSFERFTF